MIGYKAFNDDLTCRGFQYEIGKIYEMNNKPICCKNGFHFCKDLQECFCYYDFGSRICEVESLGDISTDYGGKYCTNKIRIIRELSFEEICDEIEADERLAKILIESYDITKSYKGFRCVLLGGGWADGANAEPLYWTLYYGSSDWVRNVGARLIMGEERIIFRDYYNSVTLWEIKTIDDKIEVDIKTDKEEYLGLLEEIKNNTSVDFS